MIYSRLLMTLIIAIIIVGPNDQITATPVQKADSLLGRLAEVSEDSVRIEILTELGLVFRAVDPEKSRMWYERADSLASGSGNDKQRIRIYAGRGRLEANAGDNQHALMYFNKALDSARQAKNLELEAENLVNLGIMHKRVGDYPQSKSHYLQALTIYSQMDDRQGISRTYQNLGVVTDLSGDLDKAMTYYESALQIEKELGRTIDMGSIYNNMSIIEYKRKNLAVATDMMKKSLQYYKSNYSRERWIPVYLNLGNFLIKDNMYNQALAYLDTANMLTQQYPDLQIETNLAYNYSEAWLGLRDVQKAHAYAQRNLELALKLGGVKHVADAYQLSSKVYESMGDPGQALEKYKLYKQFNDSLFNETRNREIANYQVQLDVFSKNQLIAEQQVEMLTMNQEVMREKRLRRLFFIIAMLSVTIIYLLVRQFVRNKQVRKKLEEQNRTITNQKQQIEHTNQILEQKLLRSQINPHFVFNALSSIQHLITSGEKTEALGYLSRFSRLLRQVLDGSAETTILLAEEINMLKAYIELEALRFGHSFSFSIKVDPRLEPYSYEVPALLVQPVIENAIIHGLMPLKKDRLLTVAFDLGDDEIICTVEDNGVGRKEALRTRSLNIAEHKSHGLNITTQRIKHLLNDQRENDMLVYTDLFDPEGNPAGTRVRVVIPVHS